MNCDLPTKTLLLGLGAGAHIYNHWMHQGTRRGPCWDKTRGRVVTGLNYISVCNYCGWLGFSIMAVQSVSAQEPKDQTLFKPKRVFVLVSCYPYSPDGDLGKPKALLNYIQQLAPNFGCTHRLTQHE